MLVNRYELSLDTQYVAVVCPEPTDITSYSTNGNQTQACNGDSLNPGKVYFGQPSSGVHIPAEAYLEATAPVYLYHEVAASNDEHHLLGTTEAP